MISNFSFSNQLLYGKHFSSHHNFLCSNHLDAHDFLLTMPLKYNYDEMLGELQNAKEDGGANKLIYISPWAINFD